MRKLLSALHALPEFQQLAAALDNGASPAAVSGLGLAICRSIVKAHGGSLWARNAPGGGLMLQMLLPRVAL